MTSLPLSAAPDFCDCTTMMDKKFVEFCSHNLISTFIYAMRTIVKDFLRCMDVFALETPAQSVAFVRFRACLSTTDKNSIFPLFISIRLNGHSSPSQPINLVLWRGDTSHK